MTVKSKKRRQRVVPKHISCAIALLPDSLTQTQWEKEVRKIARKKVIFPQGQWLLESYNDDVNRIIHEEVIRN